MKLAKKTFMWVFLGLLVNALTGFLLTLAPQNILVGLFKYWFLFAIGQIIITIVLITLLEKMNYLTAIILYLLYCVINGVSFSWILIVYNLSSVITVFLATAVITLLLGLFGYKTKLNLKNFGKVLFYILIGVLVVSLINIFLKSGTVNTFISILGTVLFMGYIIYDVNKLKIYETEYEPRLAVYFAFQIYLDIIILFRYLLELFGRDD